MKELKFRGFAKFFSLVRKTNLHEMHFKNFVNLRKLIHSKLTRRIESG